MIEDGREDDHHQRDRGNFLLESFGRSPGVPRPHSETWEAAGGRGAPRPSCPKERTRSTACPAGPAHFLRGFGVDRELASSHPLREALAQTTLRPAPRAQALQLLVSAQDDEFAQFDPIRTQFAPELIQGGLNRRCLGNRVATAIGRNDRSVTPV